MGMGMGLILASGSPRRRMMLETSGIPLRAVRPADIDESPHPGEAPIAYARRLAREKAAAVTSPGDWILAADTVVHVGETLYDKPSSPAAAQQALRALSGVWHSVTTAWCLRWDGGPPTRLPPPGGEGLYHAHTTTAVLFRALSDAEIAHYVATGEGTDKAGGYGIQGLGAVLVEELQGSYTSVVGLPLAPVIQALRAGGILPVPPVPLPADPA